MANINCVYFCSYSTGWHVATFHDGKFIQNMNGTTYAGESWTTNASRMEIGGWHYYSFGDEIIFQR